MKEIFLETHNIKNPYTGFGQFNFYLLKGLYNCDDPDIKFTVHTQKKDFLKKEFGKFFKYKFYMGMRRYPALRIRKRYDVWHSVNQNTKVEPHRDIPYVLTIHDVNFIEEISNDLTHPRNLRFIEKLERAHAITYISEYAKTSTHEHFKVPNVPEYVIYNGNPSEAALDVSRFSPAHKPNGKYLFTIGDFWERKNFHLLVEMMPFLADFELIIAGNNDRSYAEKVRETIAKLDLEKSVTLAGRISDEEKQYHLANATAFVFPSLREGFGLPPIEAMRFGIPVFLANATSLPEIGGDAAFYWKNFNPKDMAAEVISGLQQVAENKEAHTKKLLQQAAKFNWNTAAEQYLEVYKSLL
ncbi:glycosyltransferase involved in cell wall biosynthesis [Ulvibacter sp. MAR_2010_11]|uniref:glycosyltransferase family 4 protein n=1 Tax=Ulvibacter sp. MAR_2010_11 TaxID=1250229 RepID=UPI000C2BC3A3|nr:glycosyltransferase family 1 protein [Ulvibacter sp. MAR_2010_11]PKA83757.1 glycosyltransferase involved in cell wall biosynthesis [Ulvibacter sp. MAR_2010_11]